MKIACNFSCFARGTTRIIHGTYYPHIDGIRALAVLPVVLFHVSANLCPGGFAGVDVFFVISGYLIMGGILRDLAKNEFTISNFYYRRIRRILPAYFVMIAVVFSVGCLIYYASPLVYLADATIMGTMFSANLYFYLFSGGYFDLNIYDNPLLHLWSLSVEEQFYLFIPLLCVFVWRLRVSAIFVVLSILASLSFICAVKSIGTGDSHGAFYLTHFRAWELLAGALLAAWNVGRPPPKSTLHNCASAVHLRAFFAFLGVVLVVFPNFAISSKTPFPGLAALPSVLGTVLLLQFGAFGWASRILTWQPFVATGKISYSLYLWHWPVSVFWKYVTYGQLVVIDYLGIFILSFLLAWLSWRWVEFPVRTSPVLTNRRSFAFAAAGILILVSVGGACVCFKGWPKTLHPESNKLAGDVYPSRVGRMLVAGIKKVGGRFGFKYEDVFRRSFGSSGTYHLGDPCEQPEFLLVGDSHAGHLQYGLHEILVCKRKAGFAINQSNTDLFNLHLQASQTVLTQLNKLPKVSKVILSQAWIGYEKKEDIYTKVEEFSRQVNNLGRKLIVLSDIPVYHYSTCDIAARMKITTPRHVEKGWHDFCQAKQDYEKEQGEINRRLQVVCAKTGAVFFPAHLALLDGDKFVSFEKQNGDVIPLYRDANHLSKWGSNRVCKNIFASLLQN